MRDGSCPLYRYAIPLALAVSLLFLMVAFLVWLDAAAVADAYARTVATAWFTGYLFQIALLATEAGTAPYLVGVAILAGLLAVRLGRRRDAVLPILVLAVEWLANPSLKALFHRQRPTDEPWDPGLFGADQFSYPSGHAMASMALFSLLACWVWAWWPWRGRGAATVLVALIPVAIGLSRVAIGVHWLSDVAGGWLAGLVITSLTILVWERTGKRDPS